MSAYALRLTSPDGDFFRGPATRLCVRGGEGDLAVLAGHTPFITTVRSGTFSLETESGEVREGTCGVGILTVGKEETTLLSSSFSWR